MRAESAGHRRAISDNLAASPKTSSPFPVVSTDALSGVPRRRSTAPMQRCRNAIAAVRPSGFVRAGERVLARACALSRSLLPPLAVAALLATVTAGTHAQSQSGRVAVPANGTISAPAPATPVPASTTDGADGRTDRAAPAAAAPPRVAGRPRIGLVLSGGGGRGAAHLGVLKVLEELRIPIDMIAGTSMGSIVGAAYASGVPLKDLEAAIATISNRTLFSDTLPRQDQSPRRKQDDELPLFGPELGFANAALALPKGAVSGLGIEAVLRRLIANSNQATIEQLPIPFRAVATDIVTGQMVVFERGDVVAAVRASMSVPGAIAPAEIGGRMLVDGGLVRNLPVDVVRQLGADVVIAVNLGTPLLKRDQIGSILSISSQVVNILTEQNVQASLAQLGPDDVLVQPELGDYSAADFDNLIKTVPIGEAAARKVAPQLARWSMSPEAFAVLRGQRNALLEPLAATPVDEIRIQGLKRVNPEVIAAALETRAGRPVDPAALERDLLSIYGRGDFERVGYSLLEEHGRRVLAVDAVEKGWGPQYVRFGLGLSTDFSGDAYFNLLVSHRRTWVDALGAEWRNDLQIGRSMRYLSELYQPLDIAQRFFVAPRIDLGQRPLDVYQDRNRVARFSVRTVRAALDLGSAMGSYGEARIGLMRGFSDYELDTGLSTLVPDVTRFQLGGVNVRLRFDRLDNAAFPREGFAGSLDLMSSRTTFGASNDYTRWEASMLGASSLGRHTLRWAMKGGGRLGRQELPGYEMFSWGGFLQMSGYRTGQLTGRELVFGRLVYVYKLVDQPIFEGVHVGFSLEAARLRDGFFPGLVHAKSTSMFVGFDSPIGPMFVALGAAADGNRALYLFLGKP